MLFLGMSEDEGYENEKRINSKTRRAAMLFGRYKVKVGEEKGWYKSGRNERNFLESVKDRRYTLGKK
nr:hypothetical protein BSM_31620 [uncultured archaeon]